mgnify:CR=1 FL=1
MGDSEVYTNTIEIKENQNTIQFIPYYDGVYDESGANDITITIPTSSQTGSNYTRTDLINEINNQIIGIAVPPRFTVTISPSTHFTTISNSTYTFSMDLKLLWKELQKIHAALNGLLLANK